MEGCGDYVRMICAGERCGVLGGGVVVRWYGVLSMEEVFNRRWRKVERMWYEICVFGTH